MKGDLVMNDYEKRLLLKMYLTLREVIEQCNESTEFNNYIANKDIFARSLDEILADISEE
jgi:hypothetical protein